MPMLRKSSLKVVKYIMQLRERFHKRTRIAPWIDFSSSFQHPVISIHSKDQSDAKSPERAEVITWNYREELKHVLRKQTRNTNKLQFTRV